MTNKQQPHSIPAFAVAAFDNKRAALAIADYLSVQGISAETKSQDNETLVIVFNESQVPDARKIVESFIANPNDPKFLNASWQRNQTAAVDYQADNSALVSALKSTGWLTISLLVVIATLHLLMHLGAANTIWQALHFPYQLTQISLIELYRLWTPALLHADAPHLVFNLFWWWWLGKRIEANQSRWRLLNVTLLTGVLAHVCQYWVTGPNFVGLSGVVYGLFAYVWLYGRFSRLSDYQIPNGLAGLMVLWLAIGFSDVLWVSMANWAHLAGLLTGLALAFIDGYSLPKQTKSP
ncbi:rhomboid family intramembrane serine protease GlpG [Saccharobesus litoralis]|nr:rhomboid family intramembrane serine protease GlpG [Saccharobesus litoralis]